MLPIVSDHSLEHFLPIVLMVGGHLHILPLQLVIMVASLHWLLRPETKSSCLSFLLEEFHNMSFFNVDLNTNNITLYIFWVTKFTFGVTEMSRALYYLANASTLFSYPGWRVCPKQEVTTFSNSLNNWMNGRASIVTSISSIITFLSSLSTIFNNFLAWFPSKLLDRW